MIHKFLNRWTLKNVKRMTLEDYIGERIVIKVGSNFNTLDSFCFWSEYTHWFEKNKNTKRITKKYINNISNCQSYGIAFNLNSYTEQDKSLSALNPNFLKNNSWLKDEEVNEVIFNLTSKNWINRISNSVIDNEGNYFEDYSLEEQINKLGFYISDIKLEDENLNDAITNNFRISTLKASIKDSEFLDSNINNERKYKYENQYKWLSRFGNTKKEAFQFIKYEIIKVIKTAQDNDFDEIENSNLSLFFAWKIAYLYSNNSLIPIFRKEILKKFIENFGYDSKDKTISEMQKILIERKPPHFADNYEYARYLLWHISPKNAENKKEGKPTTIRKSVEVKNIEQQVRKSIDSYTVEQKHNLLQNKFSEKLVNKFGRNVVKMEENYVDIKLFSPNHIVFYEVKSDVTASACIKNALGQILWYAFVDKDERKKKIVVVGQFAPTNKEILFIDFLKKNLDIEFEYEYLDISSE